MGKEVGPTGHSESKEKRRWLGWFGNLAHGQYMENKSFSIFKSFSNS
jgi:hypothetical protein